MGSPPARLTVDDGGDWLVLARPRVVLGHESGGRADLPFVADVGVQHAVLERVETLRDGGGWRLAPCGRERVRVDGEALRGSRPLRHGHRVELAANLAFDFGLPDDRSASAVLRLARGAECLGATGIALLADGEAGLLRIGPAPRSHVRVRAMSEELRLVCHAGVFELRRLDPETGAPTGPSRRVARPGAPVGAGTSGRVELFVPRRGGKGAPIGVTLAVEVR